MHAEEMMNRPNGTLPFSRHVAPPTAVEQWGLPSGRFLQGIGWRRGGSRRASSWHWSCVIRGLWGSGGITEVYRLRCCTARDASPLCRLRQSVSAKRVLTDGDLDAVRETAVDPVTWRRLKLEATHTWDDGTEDVYEVESLQPREWLVANRAEVGADVPMPVDLAEMGVPDGLRAHRVIADEACPMPQNGRGRVVHEFHHPLEFVRRRFVSPRRPRPRGSDPHHRIPTNFGASRAAGVGVGYDLRPGEHAHPSV